MIRDAPRVLAAALLVVGLITACGSSAPDPSRGERANAPSRQELIEATRRQLGVSGPQAACIAGYVEQDYGPDGRRLIVEEGLGSLTQGFWQPYLTAALACIESTS